MSRVMAVGPWNFSRFYGDGMAAAAFAVAVIVLLICYWQTVQSLVWVWSHDGTYQYAFLIFPLSLWLAFNLRQEVRTHAATPSVWGLVAVALLVFVWNAGNLLDINLVQHVAFVGLFPALVLACWGWRVLWVLTFPLGYLLFAIPWGNGLVGPLQDFTAHFAVGVLKLTGTPVWLNGREIITPAATWMVADACSGVKFFIACSALGCLYAYLMYQHGWKRVMFVALAAVVPVIANGFRVYFTVLIGDTWGVEYASGVDHMIFGWQFFGAVLVCLLLVGWYLRDPPPGRREAPADDDKPTGARGVIWPVVMALLIAGPVWASDTASSAFSESSIQLSTPSVEGWNAVQAPPGGWWPTFHGAEGRVRAMYRSVPDGDVVELFHAVYVGTPRRGQTLITYGNEVYDPTHAHVLGSTGRSFELADGHGIVAMELRLSGAKGNRLVWYWYCVESRCTRSPVRTKLLQAWEVLRGRSPRSSVWALSASTDHGTTDQVRTHLRAFARGLSMIGTRSASDRRAGTGRKP